MRLITDPNEIKVIELGILIEIDKICREQNIRYFLCGGTLLGAIRHKGFIPWDDDIDISMPRPDYNKFIAYCRNHDTSLTLLSPETSPDYTNLFAKVCAKNTLVTYHTVEIEQSDHGIWVDVFPVDGLGYNYKQAKRVMNSVALRRYLLTASAWKKYFRNKWKPWYVECIRFGFFLLGKVVRDRHRLFTSIDKICKKYEFDDSNLCGAVSGYGSREILKRELYADLIDVEFEGYLFSGLKNYDTYLTSLYGDYMKLPPEEKRISHHDFDAYIQE